MVKQYPVFATIYSLDTLSVILLMDKDFGLIWDRGKLHIDVFSCLASTTTF